jgi:hypothetical protein
MLEYGWWIFRFVKLLYASDSLLLTKFNDNIAAREYAFLFSVVVLGS